MELTKLPNIGPELSRLLNEVEIRDSEELKELGAEMAFLRLKVRDPDSCFQAHRFGGSGSGSPQDPAHSRTQGGAEAVL